MLDALFKDLYPREHLDGLDVLQALRGETNALFLALHVAFLILGIDSADAHVADEAEQEYANAHEEHEAQVVIEEPEADDQDQWQLYQP